MLSRVLIADDVPELRRLLSRIIAKESGLTVVGEAEDGEDALSKALELEPDVVVIDVNMPGRSGLDVLPEIRRSLPQVTIVVFTGLSGDSVATRALALGADAVIEKGTSPAEFMDRLRGAISTRMR